VIGDQPTCEWRPGQARSLVSIEQAAERLPARDRAELIRQFNVRPRTPADRVVITRGAITSETGYASYSPLMAKMNFSRGRICETVTRSTWKESDYQGAIVFKVNGQFYGYAAVCGNLFELYGNEIPPAPPAIPPTAEAPPEIPPAAAPPAALAPPAGVPPGDTFAGGAGLPESPYGPGFPSFGGGGWFYVIGGPVVVPQMPVTPATPIPELPIWLLMLGSVGLVLKRVVQR
jgi:hypothetical protein